MRLRGNLLQEHGKKLRSYMSATFKKYNYSKIYKSVYTAKLQPQAVL